MRCCVRTADSYLLHPSDPGRLLIGILVVGHTIQTRRTRHHVVTLRPCRHAVTCPFSHLHETPRGRRLPLIPRLVESIPDRRGGLLCPTGHGVQRSIRWSGRASSPGSDVVERGASFPRVRNFALGVVERATMTGLRSSDVFFARGRLTVFGVDGR